MSDVIVAVAETEVKQPPLPKINIKPIGWGWIKKFQVAQLNLVRVSRQADEAISSDDDSVYEAFLTMRDRRIAQVQELMCKIIINVPVALIIDPDLGGFDPNNPESLDNVDQRAVQALMTELGKRLEQQEQNEVNAKN